MLLVSVFVSDSVSLFVSDSVSVFFSVFGQLLWPCRVKERKGGNRVGFCDVRL